MVARKLLQKSSTSSKVKSGCAAHTRSMTSWRGRGNRIIVTEHLSHIARRIRDFWDLQVSLTSNNDIIDLFYYLLIYIYNTYFHDRKEAGYFCWESGHTGCCNIWEFIFRIGGLLSKNRDRITEVLLEVENMELWEKYSRFRKKCE